MSNITYLLGAGASANCLPIVSNLQDRLRMIRDYLKAFSPEKLNEQAYVSDGFESQHQSTYTSLMEELYWLYETAEPHQTVDTLAKKLYHTDHKLLLKLKRALISFLVLEQLLKHNPTWEYSGKPSLEQFPQKKQLPDKRYDSFIASVLENDFAEVKLQNHIKILTWNYDVQFELAYKNYCTEKENYLLLLQEKLQIVPSRYWMNENIKKLKVEKFSIVKLNGQAIFDRVSVDPQKDYRTIFDETPKLDRDKLNKFFSIYSELFKNNWEESDCLRLLNFSWESNPKFELRYNMNDTINFAKLIAQQTEVLVVIGYSFPFFNRETDRMLIDGMKKLKKVYIQDVESRVESIISVFKSSFTLHSNDISIVPVIDTNSFFLPPEL